MLSSAQNEHRNKCFFPVLVFGQFSEVFAGATRHHTWAGPGTTRPGQDTTWPGPGTTPARAGYRKGSTNYPARARLMRVGPVGPQKC